MSHPNPQVHPMLVAVLVGAPIAILGGFLDYMGWWAALLDWMRGVLP